MKINSGDMDALIALGVSYTNEMYREEALEALGKRTDRDRDRDSAQRQRKSAQRQRQRQRHSAQRQTERQRQNVMTSLVNNCV